MLVPHSGTKASSAFSSNRIHCDGLMPVLVSLFYNPFDALRDSSWRTVMTAIHLNSERIRQHQSEKWLSSRTAITLC
jgi:hypothetical protein